MSETEQLARFTTELDFDELPSETVERAKSLLLDIVGVSLYGTSLETSSRVIPYVRSEGGNPEATAIGYGQTSVSNAALVNGTLGHAADYDDSYLSFPIHPSAPVYATTLAVAESTNASGRDIVTGFVAGLEAVYRLGMSFHPSHYEAGWHSTSTLGTLGATLAAASVLDLTTDQTRQALGMAASSSSGVKGSNFGSMTKALHAGHAAQMGVRSARLAANDVTASRSILEEQAGYRDVMIPGDVYDPDAVETIDDGDAWDWELVRKSNPSGIMTQAAMETTRDLVRENDVTADDVDTVTLTLPITHAVTRIGSESESSADSSRARFKRPPRNEHETLMSFPFCVAAVLLQPEPPNVHQFADATDLLASDAMVEQMAKVETTYDPDLFEYEHGGFGADVRIETTDGSTFQRREKYPPDSSHNPLPEERFREKFYACAGYALDDSESERVLELITTIEDVDGAAGLFDGIWPDPL